MEREVKIKELAEYLIKSLDESWDKSEDTNEEYRQEVFMKYVDRKLNYMKEEGFISGYTLKEKDNQDE